MKNQKFEKVWFKYCTNIEELKTQFRKLILDWHPDRNNDPNATRFTQNIILEFNYILNSNDFGGLNMPNYDIENEILQRENYIKLINELFKMPGLIIELIGSWLWVSGNTYNYRKELKNLGLQFAPKKCMWFYRDGEFKAHKYNGENQSIDEIKQKYGFQTIENQFKSKIIA